MGFFSKAKPEPAKNYDTEFIPEETSIYVHGVSFRQAQLHQLGTGKKVFALVAETNSSFENAVMVMGMKNGTTIHVGYLPAVDGEDKRTAALYVLSVAMMANGKLPVVNGVVRKDKDGFMAEIRTPYMRTTTSLTKAIAAP